MYVYTFSYYIEKREKREVKRVGVKSNEENELERSGNRV
jgi:hypothetical protein